METESQPAGAAHDEAVIAGPRTSEGHANARKRKKTSRACDFCHVNHQPCDNAEPRCSVCEKHNKSCQYNRPQKKRGPAKGYRSTLNSLNESAAAWGAALNLIPSLGSVIEGYLKTPEGQRLIRAIKDPKQQDFFIRSWQESGVFRTFFGGEGTPEDGPMGSEAMAPGGFPHVSHPELPMVPPPPLLDQKPLPLAQPPAHKSPALASVSSHGFPEPGQYKMVQPSHPPPPRPPMSVSDIVARDAARQVQDPIETLGPLGFGPNETYEDFHAMPAHPEPFPPHLQPGDSGLDLNSDPDQRTYYELIMSRQFHQQYG